MNTIITLNPQTASIADIIAALGETNLSDSAKLQVISKAADSRYTQQVVVYLNHYFADSKDEYVDDADAAIAAHEEAVRRAEAKAKAEAQELERKTLCMNAAASNLALRGVKPFKDGQINPDYQKELNAEIAKLLKGEKMLVTADGEYFVPGSSRSNMSEAQLAAMDKAEIDRNKSNKTVSLEAERPMSDGQHEVTISYYKEKNGRNGRPDYAVVQVQEESTGKRTWLMSWTLEDPDKAGRDSYRTRYAALQAIARNNHDLCEGYGEDEAVELLRKAPFSIWTFQKKDGTVAAYLDKEQYLKFIRRQRIAEELAEEREKREEALMAQGLDLDAQDESYEKNSYKM